MIGGSVIIEYIFSIRGHGQARLTTRSCSRDYPVTMAITTFAAFLVHAGHPASPTCCTAWSIRGSRPLSERARHRHPHRSRGRLRAPARGPRSDVLVDRLAPAARSHPTAAWSGLAFVVVHAARARACWRHCIANDRPIVTSYQGDLKLPGLHELRGLLGPLEELCATSSKSWQLERRPSPTSPSPSTTPSSTASTLARGTRERSGQQLGRTIWPLVRVAARIGVRPRLDIKLPPSLHGSRPSPRDRRSRSRRARASLIHGTASWP